MPLLNTSLLTLIAANLIPLIGVLFLGWDVSLVVIVYWVENVVVGFYSILKIIFAHVPNLITNLGKLFIVGFFSIHYGGFCAVHGLFVLALTQGTKNMPSMDGVGDWWGPLAFLQLLFAVIGHLIATGGITLLWPVAGLMVSHGVSFVENYILGGEYLKTDGTQAMSAPYSRIVILHIAILAGAAPVMMLGSPTPLLVLLVLMKIGVDIKLHKKSHARFKDKCSTNKYSRKIE